METNNYTTNLQLVSQEYPDEKTSLQTKTKKLLEYFSPKDIWKIKGLISPVSWPASYMSLT